MRLIVSIITSLLFFALGGAMLVLMHPIQYASLRLGGARAQQKVITFSARLMLFFLRVTGARIAVRGNTQLPDNRPVILVSNHQSLFDIPLIQVYFARFSPKYIAKHQLGKHFPSVSIALRYNGSVLIDRDNQAQAIRQIFELGQRITETNHAAVIFPEGSRHRDGIVHPFKSAGLKALLKKTPQAHIVPIVIQGNAQLFRRSRLFICFGTRIRLNVLEPVEQTGKTADELIAEIHEKMQAAMEST